MNRREAAPWIAANKFGLGLRPGERAEVAHDPRGWLKQQLSAIAAIPPALESIPHSTSLLIEARQTQMRLRALQMDQLKPGVRQELLRIRGLIAERQEEQQKARLLAAIDSETPFSERLVRFWSNHFTVAIGEGAKDAMRHVGLPYESEAIRPNLERSFFDLLLAVARHPAMLIYLDNSLSVGPNSPFGRKRGRGLNENLAREILELHTLGVDGGYTQRDVTALAAILTGWGFDQRFEEDAARPEASRPGGFKFDPGLHEPGVQRVLGKTYEGSGPGQGEDALRELARHPSTARHVARKLVMHFVADVPPPSAVEKIERTFLETGGWLPAVHEALIDLEEAWDPAQRKYKTPDELVVSVARACMLPGRAQNPQLVLRTLNQALKTFGQVPFSAGSPAGWPDVAVSWGNPDAVLKRIEWLNALTQLIPSGLDPLALRGEILPRHAALWHELDRAESENQALVLLLASPSFQWRGA